MPLPVPITASMAALRTLRRAPWGECLHTELTSATAALIDPMAEMTVAWSAVVASLRSYQRHRDAMAWTALQSNLARFDRALASFFGPSGWEHP